MDLRKKLLLPLILTSTLMAGYLFAIWIPGSLASAEAEDLDYISRHLDSVVEGVIPLLLGHDLDIIQSNFDALLEKNQDWISIRLIDSEGHRIYPLFENRAFNRKNGSTELRTLSKPIRYLGTELGVLVLQVDLAPALETDRRQHRYLMIVLLTMLSILTVTLILSLEFVVRRPVRLLSVASSELARQRFDTPLPRAGGDEVGALVSSFASMRSDLQSYQMKLEEEISERKSAEEALRQLNETLEQRVQKEVAESRQKDHILIQQSRLAAMGEMVHNIAHQWRQPLNALGLLISNLRDDFRFQTITEESLDQDVARARRLIEGMSTTIDDFRDFFRPDREKSVFDVGKSAREALFIIEAAYRNNRIELVQNVPEGIETSGFSGQYSQAVLNVLVNAKEAILARHVENGRVSVELSRQGERGVLIVEDNGGGIPEDILPRIFDPYFTTKDQGSGIGLYMVKMIIEKNMEGRVSAENGESGARFLLDVPLSHDPSGGFSQHVEESE